MKKVLIIAAALLLPGVASAATLSVSPSSQSVNVGDTFSVTVGLNTQGTAIDGVDLRYVNYNTSLLQVQDSNSSSAGVQIAPGSLMSATLANSVDSSLGRITFSQVATGGTKYNGSGTLATISFKALAAGTANLTFNYTANNTTDSNVAANGTDVLNAVINGSYSISSPGGNPNPTPTPTPTPTPPPSSTGGGGGSSGGGASGTGTVCTSVGSTIITIRLALGSRGAETLALQKFLVGKGLLAADNTTGYFGALTQAAVQAFQRAQGIASSGTPLTTGYGAVGPTTRARIGSLSGGSSCSGETSTQALQAQIQALQAQVQALLLKLQSMQH